MNITLWNRLVAVLFALALATFGRSANAQETSLNVVTLNAAMVPGVPLFHKEANYGDCGVHWTGVPDYNCRANYIADRILEADYDVVIVNEVFADSPKYVLSNRLRHRFPHQVIHLEDGGATGGAYVFGPDQDSGLMIFSRFPMLPSSQQYIQSCWVGLWDEKTVGAAEVMFRGFGDDSLGDDRLASKGVGYVRIQTNSKVYNVFFTHMQASYGGTSYCEGPQCDAHKLQDWAVRRTQLNGVIKSFAECNLDPWQYNSEVTLLAGDLNINGDLSNPWDDDSVILGSNARHSRFEWDYFFNPASTTRLTLGGTGVTEGRDLWATSMTPAPCLPGLHLAPVPECQADPFPPGFKGPAEFDRGFTYHGVDGKEIHEERLDNIIMSSPANPSGGAGEPDTAICAQSVTAAWNLWIADNSNPGFKQEGGLTGEFGLGSPVSDHFGLNAELEFAAPYCNPTHALVDPPDGVQLELEFERSMQWIKITTPGTYVFNVNPVNQNPPGANNDVQLRVFLPTDLSRPIASNFGEAQTVPPDLQLDLPGYTDIKYHVLKAPFYIKVFQPGLEQHRAYTFRWHRNTCTSQEEACELTPFENREGEAPLEPFPFSAGYEKWYTIHSDRSDGGAYQTASFYITEPRIGDPNIESIELFDATLTPIPGYSQSSPSIVSVNGADHYTWRFGPHADGALDEASKKSFLKITRRLESTANFEHWVGWETDLTWIVGPSWLKCSKLQEGPHDEIWGQVNVDGWWVPGDLPGGDNAAGIQDGREIGSFSKGSQKAFMTKLFGTATTTHHGEHLFDDQAIKCPVFADIQVGEDDSEYDEIFTRNLSTRMRQQA